MAPKITSRTQEIFNDALAQSTESRSAFLAQACGGDQKLLQTVKQLIDAYEAVRTVGLQNAPEVGGPSQGVNAEVLHALRERYEDIQLVGMGGMGVVFRAVDREINEIVALKILHPSLAKNERAAERFRNEIRLAREITHRNVCRTYDWHRLGGALVISMEFVEGETLRDILDRVRGVSVPQGLLWSAEICDALAAAHEHRIVHRDLKPENIMIDVEGRVKVMDFGIACSLDVTVDAPHETPGTPSYMSPEQKSGKEVGPASDIYSLGLVLYELFTGVRCKPASPIRPAGLNPYLPVQLSDGITRCLEQEPEHRFQSASELKAALQDRNQGGIHQHRLRRRLVVGASLLGVVALLSLFYVWRLPTPPPQDKINALAFSPDGRMLASGSEDRTVILWDSTAQTKIKTLVNHIRAVTALAFSADSRWLASGGGDTTIKVIDVTTGRVRASLPEMKEILALALSPDGRWLASTADESIKLWDVAGGIVVRKMSHEDVIQDLAFSKDGRLLASASTDRTVGVWDIATGHRVAPSLRHDDLVDAVVFSPDGSLLASGSYDKTVKLWSTATWDTLQTLWQGERVSDLSFTPDGTALLSISERGTVKIWRAPTWQTVATLSSKEPALAATWAIHPTGRSLAIGLDDGHVLVQRLPQLPGR